MSHLSATLLLCCGVVILGSQCAQAAVAVVNYSNPSHPGKCVLDPNTVMSPGQQGKAPDHLCAGVTCMEGGFVQFKTCATEAPDKGCKLRDFVNINRPYPACCERTYDCNKQI